MSDDFWYGWGCAAAFLITVRVLEEQLLRKRREKQRKKEHKEWVKDISDSIQKELEKRGKALVIIRDEKGQEHTRQ